MKGNWDMNTLQQRPLTEKVKEYVAKPYNKNILSRHPNLRAWHNKKFIITQSNGSCRLVYETSAVRACVRYVCVYVLIAVLVTVVC